MSLIAFRNRKTRTAEPPGRGAAFSEVFALDPADGAAAGFVLARLPQERRPLLWIQDRLSRREAGTPYLPGIGRPFLHLTLARARDVAAAMEEGLRSQGLAAVVGEIWGEGFDFTASRRIALRAEAGGPPCWLIRRAAVPGLSAARDRWRAISLPSSALSEDPAAPGDPRWRVELFRSRLAPTGAWEARHDRAANRLDLGAPASGPPAARPPAPLRRDAG